MYASRRPATSGHTITPGCRPLAGATKNASALPSGVSIATIRPAGAFSEVGAVALDRAVGGGGEVGSLPGAGGGGQAVSSVAATPPAPITKVRRWSRNLSR